LVSAHDCHKRNLSAVAYLDKAFAAAGTYGR
jgi:hypothetical protein